ncbi:hypothetical protein KIL84_016426 [Mauremys mutica]|uniref:Uncharacterized protein n=1 Tax=Mauremys mutica TaxID=74926 RepID=A0A9D4AQQ6_9SAUR|nr:hypothetical protein KIL84_016426 [Mauremys mutica]
MEKRTEDRRRQDSSQSAEGNRKDKYLETEKLVPDCSYICTGGARALAYSRKLTEHMESCSVLLILSSSLGQPACCCVKHFTHSDTQALHICRIILANREMHKYLSLRVSRFQRW